MIGFPLIGNTHIKASVTNALSEKRLPHAVLIEGDIGTGRHTLAGYLARAIVCENKLVPCDECKNCGLAQSGNHPDIKITAPEDGKKNIAVAQIRALKAETVIKPHIANANVFIIDFADTMNEQSQNALLKVLEEPPQNTYFILIAESKAAFLETVISRCVIFTLSTPETDIAVEYISERTDYPLEDIKEAVISEKNNIGKALLLLEGKGETEASIWAKEFLDCMFSKNMWGMLNSTAKAEKNRILADKFIKELKYQTAVLLRKNVNTYKAKVLSMLYTELATLEKSLVTNINLSLLFCTLVSRASNL